MTQYPGNIDAAPERPASCAMDVLCDRCSSGILQPARISSVLWQGDRLVMVRNIPAMICPECGEEYIDDFTVVRLDWMRGNGFQALPLIERVSVPVLDYGGSGAAGSGTAVLDASGTEGA